MLTPAFAIITALFVLATLAPGIRTSVWWIRGFDFPRLQLLLLSAVVLVAQLAFHPIDEPWTLAIIVLNAGCMLWQAWWIWPYTPLARTEVEDASAGRGTRIRLMASNVMMHNRDSDRLLALVREHRPDVLIALETDAWWESQLDALLEQMPHVVRCPLDNLYGMHLYARLPLDDVRLCYLVEDDIPSIHATLELDGQRVALHALHPRPPSPTESDSSKERDAELVLVGKAARKSRVPVIVAGDLNDVAWSRTTRLFRKVSGLLDPRIGRGMYNTFHARMPGLRWPLDHLFHSDHFALVAMRRLPDIGSDHFPILVELALAPGRNDDDAGLDIDAQAVRDATAALDDVDADAAAPVPQ